ncbi:twin-arginine translocation signal domain-containing protein [Cellulomonas fimi]|uniref:Extracellular solute-binding protein family 1 n=1 Tax=Cellulomonas fimi (strain ATCC 484 / DSM 20113 / JCM 1341 / CCUG 24087 / LMG 16345 / NBRC 15513 / NCIMB 8980 / NCTC 7547 / NRS-133) TaxID=590998 RepID=F4H7F3_CELFA|nr:twin-arginine translocation signal domain-containing protein [Cellulomonas fimi]AEE46914.1 extracellular solute-binding protein family 1 [Cellulomonas fimi ATCC 484]NNH07861.1 extracellular solute-binding protein [Cellulomonas fimi]VEH34549.1 Lipoprotein lplA [Cellulomonas fimi]
MTPPPQLGRLGDVALDRRSFLGMLAAGAAVVGVPSLLSACSPGTPTATATGAAAAGDVIPTYIPVTYAEPDYPSVDGSVPGYETIPAELVRSVQTAPGTGLVFTAMTPLWGTIPPTKGNKYYEAVNGLLGSDITFQITDGNVYGDKLATVLASPKDVPDWVCVPTWNLPPRFGAEIVGNVFQDLTPFLAGDLVEDYPNLANIPSDAWKFCVFNGRLYGLPFPGETITDAIFYRKDVLDGLGITPDVKNAQDLLDLAKELTGGNVWGAEDLWNTAAIIHGVVPKWKLEGDTLVHRVETDEYRAALEWNAALFASGSVHPDAVAGQTGDAKMRFQGGQSLIANDGVGGWHEAMRDNLASNPSYWQQPFDPFAADGGTPVLWKGNPANIFSFLKKTDDEARIKELLALANVLAAPFGTVEFDTITNGVEGVHYTRGDDGLPVPTDLAATELQPTYIFLVDPPLAESHVQYPGYVKAVSEWKAKASGFAQDPLFYAQQIVEPAQYASIGQPFVDLEKDISRGRKSMKDLDAAIETWRSSGGEELRAFYQDILDSQA